MKKLAIAFIILFILMFIFTWLGKYFKIKPNPYEQRFYAHHSFADFLKDHENNVYIFNNLFKKNYGFLIFICTIILAYIAIIYICLIGCCYLIYYLIHFSFIYDKQHPYVIDLRDYVEKTDPTLFDCIKSINKIAKSAAYTRFYKILQLRYLKKKPQVRFLRAAQIFIVSWLLGYSSWFLYVIIDIAINICKIAGEKNFFKKLKILIAKRIHWDYSLSSLNPKELRIYWFDGQWVFNPGGLRPQLKLWSINHSVTPLISITHTGLGYNFNSNDKYTPIFFFTRHPKPWAKGLEIVNSTLKYGSQYLITNQLTATSQVNEIGVPNKILLNCGIDKAEKMFVVHKFALFNCAKQANTVLESEYGIEIINNSPISVILNNCSGKILFTDETKKNAEVIYEEIEKQSQWYQAYQSYFKDQPLDLKQFELIYPDLLKYVPINSINWEE